MNRRRLGFVLAFLAVLCLVGGAFGPTASADRNGKVQLAIGGRGFSANPTGPLLDTSGLAPGRSAAALFGVRSRFGVATKLSLQFTDVRDDDNGCSVPEALVDTTCGVGQGDLGRNLAVTVSAGATRTGDFKGVWRGRATDLTSSTTLGLSLAGDSDTWLRIVASVPASVGNVVQTDTFRFGVRVVLSGNGVEGQSGVQGQRTGHHGESNTGSGVEGLASTGFSTVLFGVGGVLLIVAGTVLLSAARRQRRATSASSSTGRRAPRPASPR